jgi:hypothetical protein
MITAVALKVAATPIELPDGTRYKNLRAARLAAEEMKDTNPIRCALIQDKVFGVLKHHHGEERANEIMGCPVTPDSPEDIARRAAQREYLKRLKRFK